MSVQMKIDRLSLLRSVLLENRVVKQVEDEIYSVLPDASKRYPYDTKATGYDLIVGTRLYNLGIWGTSPLAYVDFARRAVASSEGRLLDAGCGSMLFTAPTYLESARPVIAFDQSLGMLRRARQRLLGKSKFVPERIVLVQADLSDLPFRSATFQTILCMNVLHHYQDAAALIKNLAALRSDEGDIYFTSLVSNNRPIGDLYLAVLYRTGQFVRPRSNEALKKALVDALIGDVSYRVKGNMAFASSEAIAVSADSSGNAQE